MKSIYVGVNKANMIDDRGVIHTAIRDGKLWMFEGLVYYSPFKAVRNVERSRRK